MPAIGSLAHFFTAGDLTCVISEVYISEDEELRFNGHYWPIFDIGFDPENIMNNNHWVLELQYRGFKAVVNNDIASMQNALTCAVICCVVSYPP